jgi:hypothetical protein
MTTGKIHNRSRGHGFLTLKSGLRKRVNWEIQSLNDGSFDSGCIVGNKNFLQAAAKDGCGTLQVSHDVTAAIAIDGHEDGRAPFTTLSIATKPHIFRAQTICGSSPILDGTQFSICLLSEEGKRFYLYCQRT